MLYIDKDGVKKNKPADLFLKPLLRIKIGSTSLAVSSPNLNKTKKKKMVLHNCKVWFNKTILKYLNYYSCLDTSVSYWSVLKFVLYAVLRDMFGINIWKYYFIYKLFLHISSAGLGVEIWSNQTIFLGW
jgi:hypothetical protein